MAIQKIERISGCWGLLTVGFRILDLGFRVLDFGLWILDFGFWILGFGFFRPLRAVEMEGTPQKPQICRFEMPVPVPKASSKTS